MNRELFGGTTANSATRAISVTPSYSTNKAIAQIYFNSNTGITSVTCTHSTQGALTEKVSLIQNFGTYISFELTNIEAGTVTFNWTGGGIGNYADVVVIENADTIVQNATSTGTGTASVSVLSTGTATDHFAFCGQRFATAAPTPDVGDSELNNAFGDSIGVSNIYETWGSGDTADWSISGGSVWLAVSYLITEAVSYTLSNPTDPIEFDSTGNTVEASGFTGNLSSLTDQGSGYSYVITNQSGGDPNTVTFDAFALLAMDEASGGEVGPFIGPGTLDGTYTPSDPDEVGSVAVNMSLPTGYNSVVLSGSSNDPGTVGYGLNEVHGLGTVDTDVCAFPTDNNTVVNADGTIQTDNTDLYFYIYKVSTNTWYAVRFLWAVAGDDALRCAFRRSVRHNLRLDVRRLLRLCNRAA